MTTGTAAGAAGEPGGQGGEPDASGPQVTGAAGAPGAHFGEGATAPTGAGAVGPRRGGRPQGPPGWWHPGRSAREVLLGLAATPGPIPAATAGKLAGGRDPVGLLRPDSPDPGDVAARLSALGVRFLLPADPEWPFADAPDPPCAWLFAAGRPLPAAGMVAIVGGRRASPLRLTVAGTLAAALADAGWVVVSGGAVGVDAAAHRGALDAGGTTIAVLGCGLDVGYPRANAALLRRVREGGTVVSEHPPGAPPRPANFVPRNRLIASLGAAVVVVEAAERSGSIATARAAGSRGTGRVLVVPGAPWDPGAAGCNALIRDGATLVRGVADVLAELDPLAVTAERPAPATARLDPAARRVLGALVDGVPIPPARLAALTGLTPATAGRAVVALELAGLARRSAAGVQAVAGW
jgi:DNA processing protein